jgi:hypothetical protein
MYRVTNQLPLIIPGPQRNVGLYLHSSTRMQSTKNRDHDFNRIVATLEESLIRIHSIRCPGERGVDESGAGRGFIIVHSPLTEVCLAQQDYPNIIPTSTETRGMISNVGAQRSPRVPAPTYISIDDPLGNL